MAIDSTAELLFNISANADDATENVARFRALMGQDLDGMTEQFGDWSEEILGKLETVKGAMIAFTAALAAGLLAVGVALKESMGEYEDYANSIYKATQLTGLSSETLSALHSAAAKTNTSFEVITQSLGRFSGNIVLASQGSKVQSEAFGALGISQAEVSAGQKDMLPLLERVMDGFHANASAVQKASIARTLFSRGGTELIEFLSKGSAYLKENSAEAEKYGLMLHKIDIDAAHEFMLTQAQMKDEMEGFSVTIGKHLMPMLESLMVNLLAVAAAMKAFATHGNLYTGAIEGLKAYAEEYGKVKKEVADGQHGAEGAAAIKLMDNGQVEKVKEAKTEFGGLASIVDSLRGKIASLGTPWDQMRQEVAHYHEEIDKATAQLNKLHTAGKITAESYKTEMAALAQIPQLLGYVVTDTTKKLAAADTQAWGEAIVKSLDAQDAITYNLQKAGEDRAEVDRQIVDKMAASEEQGYAQQRAQVVREMHAWAQELMKKSALTVENWNDIDRITAEGMAKIDRTQAGAWQQEVHKLHEHLDAATGANESAQQKLYSEEQKALAAYSQIEEDKALKTAQSEAQVNQILQMYAAIRSQIFQKYQDDLQKLQNSQGWQGVFGNYFGTLIRGNQQMMQQWAQSSNQSLMMVRMSLEALREQSVKTFQSMVQGMAQTMIQAFATGKSVAQAMEQMLSSTLESFAAQAITAAIMATAWGFYDLAMGNHPAALAAFTSAELFGTVGAAAAVSGLALGGSSQSGSSASSGSGGPGNGSGGSGSAFAGAAAGAAQSHTYVNVSVNGPVIGPSGAVQLCDIINQAVYGHDAKLYASHNPQGVPL